MSRFLLSFKRQAGGGAIPPVTPDQPVTPLVSDLVALGILEKQVSAFTTDDIGKEIVIPYDNVGSGIDSPSPIVFEVVGVNHHTNSEHDKTITLMTKFLIRKAAFDAAEPSNSNSDRKSYGNNRWSVSNIRQWLNSSGAAGSWFKPQHTADAAPISSNVLDADAAYADAPGFLAGFSADILQHFTDITNITALCTADGGGSETTVDKVFLPSCTEMRYGNNGNVAEGSPLPKFTDDDSRKKIIKGGGYGSYWMRSPDTDSYAVKRIVTVSGRPYNLNDKAYSGLNYIAPIIVLH